MVSLYRVNGSLWQFPIPDSLPLLLARGQGWVIPIHYSLFTIHYSLFPISQRLRNNQSHTPEFISLFIQV